MNLVKGRGGGGEVSGGVEVLGLLRRGKCWMGLVGLVKLSPSGGLLIRGC